MTLDQRSQKIFDIILQNPNITSKELAGKASLTRKQISYSIDKINVYLKNNGLPMIERLRTGKFTIYEDVLTRFASEAVMENNVAVDYSIEERRWIIILQLLFKTEFLSLYHFLDILKISKNTFLADIKKIQQDIQEQEIEIVYNRQDGYCMSGHEFAIRKLIHSTVQNVMNLPNGQHLLQVFGRISDQELFKFQNELEESEKHLGVRFSDNNFIALPFIFLANIRRIEQGELVKRLPDAYVKLSGSKEYCVVKELLQQYHIEHKMEICLLTAQMQISSIQAMEQDMTIVQTQLIAAIISTVEQFEHIACVSLENKETLVDMLRLHCRSAFYRIRYHFHIDPDITDLILPKYQHIHTIVQKSIFLLEVLIGETIPLEEMVYITALFCAWLKRTGNQLIEQRWHAIIVCRNGVTVSNYFMRSLQELFPEIHFITCLSFREFNNFLEEYDIVFTTISLKTNKPQLILPNFLLKEDKDLLRIQVIQILNEASPVYPNIETIIDQLKKYVTVTDKKGLENFISQRLFQRTSSVFVPDLPAKTEKVTLSDVLTTRNIHVLMETPSWKKAIWIASSALIESKKINVQYVDRMIDIIENEQPFLELAKGVVFAHAGVDDGVNEVGFAILTMPDKISIAGYIQADIIVIIATPNKKIHLRALYQLNELLEDEKQAAALRQAKTAQEIIKLIDK